MQGGIDPDLPQFGLIHGIAPLFQRVFKRFGLGGGRYNQLE